MKAALYIYIDDYQMNIDKIKSQDEFNIRQAIFEYLKEKGYNFTVELKRYMDPVVLNVPNDFIEEYTNKKILLPVIENMNKSVKIKFEYIDTINYICECSDIYCSGSCRGLQCGCMDVCRNKCRYY